MLVLVVLRPARRLSGLFVWVSTRSSRRINCDRTKRATKSSERHLLSLLKNDCDTEIVVIEQFDSRKDVHHK